MYHSYIIPERNFKAKFEENQSELRRLVFQFFLKVVSYVKQRIPKSFKKRLLKPIHLTALYKYGQL